MSGAWLDYRLPAGPWTARADGLYAGFCPITIHSCVGFHIAGVVAQEVGWEPGDPIGEATQALAARIAMLPALLGLLRSVVPLLDLRGAADPQAAFAARQLRGLLAEMGAA